MFEGYKHIFNNKIDNVQATDDEFRLKLVELYQIIQLLLPYKHNIRKYYYRFSEYQIIEQLKDRLLLNKFSSKWIYQRMTEKKLYRRGTQ
ncbi:hypothetical protein SDC9_99792 [bioreactor metagenome]|uniref:Uncharacterized protein n=1 Tax=bioreactor metagenome TaxID=1076179 RepID=A0A645AJV7_9ZZZZ